MSAPLALLDEAVARGDRDALARFVAERFASTVGANEKLVTLALSAAGDASDRARIDAHQREPEWSKHVPLALLPFAPLVGAAPDFSRTVVEELAASPFGTARIDALARGDLAAARTLRDELDDIARMAATSADDVTRLRAHMREKGLHAMQAAALMRAIAVRPRLSSTGGAPRALEIGAAEGELVSALAAEGFDAWGRDVLPSAHPRVTVGDFLVDAPSERFALVIATALLEWGSGIDPAVLDDAPRVLERLGALVDDGGALVLENVRLPLPFTRADVARAGFVVVEHEVPSPTLAMGGRGVTLLRA